MVEEHLEEEVVEMEAKVVEEYQREIRLVEVQGVEEVVLYCQVPSWVEASCQPSKLEEEVVP